MVSAGHSLDGIPIQMVQKIGVIQGRRQPIEMSPGIGAHVRVAGGVGTKTDSVLGGQTDPLQSKPPLLKQHQGLEGGSLAGVAGGEKKDPFGMALAKRLDGRKQRRHGLADTGGGLDNRLAAIAKGAVNGDGHMSLAASISRKGKVKGQNGGIPRLTPPGKGRGPCQIPVDQSFKKGFQLIAGLLLDEFQGIAGIQVAIGQLNGHRRQTLPAGQQICVYLGLAPVAGIVGCFERFQVPGRGLDLLDNDSTPCVVNAIDAASHHQGQLRGVHFHGNRHLGTIPLRPLTLDFLVGANPL